MSSVVALTGKKKKKKGKKSKHMCALSREREALVWARNIWIWRKRCFGSIATVQQPGVRRNKQLWPVTFISWTNWFKCVFGVVRLLSAQIWEQEQLRVSRWSLCMAESIWGAVSMQITSFSLKLFYHTRVRWCFPPHHGLVKRRMRYCVICNLSLHNLCGLFCL